jgi:DNA-binding LacI/PurR family transcriptional regulator
MFSQIASNLLCLRCIGVLGWHFAVLSKVNVKPNKKGTFQDVARLAGVSTATVSRVAGKSARVSPAVEKRVRAAAEELDVILERRNSGRLIAFLLGNRSLLHPFHSQVLVSSEAYCAERDYSVVFFPIHYPGNVPAGQLHLPRILERTDLVDGFIVSGLNWENLLQFLAHTGLPFSVYGDTVEGDWNRQLYDVVWLDDSTGAYEMTRYLQALGHEHIWFIANTRRVWFARREEGYRRAMEEMGLRPLISGLDSDNEREVGFLAAKYILRQGEPVQAIFCGADAICHGVYAALREAGLRVPDDISVAGFNDTPEATVLHPPVTSMHAFPEHTGRLLAELVMNRISNPTLAPQERMILTQIVKRESCRPALAERTAANRPSLETVGDTQRSVSSKSAQCPPLPR